MIFEDHVAWRRSTKVQHICFGITVPFCIMCYVPYWWYGKLPLLWLPSWVLCAYIKVFHRFGNGRPKVSGWLMLPKLTESLGNHLSKIESFKLIAPEKAGIQKKERKEKVTHHSYFPRQSYSQCIKFDAISVTWADISVRKNGSVIEHIKHSKGQH